MGARFRAPLSGLQASPINLVAANLGSVILLKLLNAGNYAGAAEQLPRWNKADGQTLAGLTNRRAADAAVLFDKAFRYLTDMPTQRVHQQICECFSVPSADGCPGIRAPWGNEFGPMIEGCVRCAETWLDGSSLPLWWALAQNRKRHHPGDPQEAFEAGFLLRLQQTLIMRSKAATSQSASFDA